MLNFTQPQVNSMNFAQVPVPRISRSKLDRSHGYTTTFDADFIYPLLVDEILPSDTVSLDSTFFLRINTLLHPVMDNLHFDVFAFFIPFRLVWDHWQKFMGEQENPSDSTDYLIPHLQGPVSDPTNFDIESGSLYDYMTMPIGNIATGYEKPSSLYARAYNLVFNQWFRDENLQDSVAVPKGDGPDNYQLYSLLRRNKRKDMATSALPWQQKGDPVNLPLGTSAPVIGTGDSLGLFSRPGGGTPSLFGLTIQGGFNSSGGGTGGSVFAFTNFYGDSVQVPTETISGSSPNIIGALGVTSQADYSGLVADLTAASTVTINDLRTAIAVQQLRELYARGGTRYVELLRSEFDAISPDFRLQRAEYLGGTSKRMNISAVPQTSASSEDSPQANLSAYGSHLDHLRVRYNSVEHGILLVLGNVRADIRYQNVMRKIFTRRTMLEFFHPTLQNLGEEAVYRREVNFVGDAPSVNGVVFGYQERYYDYRYMPSFITGKMRSGVSGSLDVWHLAQDLGNSLVSLNTQFITSDTPMDRVVAVSSEPIFYADIWHKYHHTRPMAVRSIPGLLRL